MDNMEIIVPAGFFGASDTDSLLDKMLREIGLAIDRGDQHWASKYGADYDSGVFMMHHFCWCESDDCPWCVGCECPEGRYYETLDGERSTWEQFSAFYDKATAGLDVNSRAYDEAAQAAHSRRKVETDPSFPACDYCTGAGIFTPFKPYTKVRDRHYYDPPNFWYKPTDFRLIWYKFIGRDMETNRDITPAEIMEIYDACLRDLSARAAPDTQDESPV